MQIIDEILNLLFPNVCGICGKIDKNSLCPECEKKITQKYKYKIQNIYGKNFEKHIYIMEYEGFARHKILAYKFDGNGYLYKTFARIITNNKKVCKILKEYDIITEVPVHKKRKNKRGYDQSQLIAKDIAKNIGPPKYAKTLKKIKNNPRQSLLNEKERINNVKNVYETINKEIIKDKKIILFDDIYTTGSTADECSRILKENGAKEILVLSLAA